jgi:hypothetical protein
MIWLNNSANGRHFPKTVEEKAAAGKALALATLELHPEYVNKFGIMYTFWIIKDAKTGVMKYAIQMSMINSVDYVKPTTKPLKKLTLDDFVTTNETVNKTTQQQKKQPQKKQQKKKVTISLDDFDNVDKPTVVEPTSPVPAEDELFNISNYSAAELDALFADDIVTVDEPTSPVVEPTSPTVVEPTSPTSPVVEPTSPIPPPTSPTPHVAVVKPTSKKNKKKNKISK